MEDGFVSAVMSFRGEAGLAEVSKFGVGHSWATERAMGASAMCGTAP